MKKMTLKEAFTLQTKLEKLFNDSLHMFTTQYFRKNIITHNLEASGVPNQQNRVEEVDSDMKKEGITFKNCMDFLNEIVKAKEELSQAIDEAKAGLKVSIDTLKGLNRTKQRVIAHLEYLASNTQPINSTTNGCFYTIDKDGKQVGNIYKMDTEVSLDIDDSLIEKEIDKLTELTNKTSIDVDSILVNTYVDYKLPFNIRSSVKKTFKEWVR